MINVTDLDMSDFITMSAFTDYASEFSEEAFLPLIGALISGWCEKNDKDKKYVVTICSKLLDASHLVAKDDHKTVRA